MVEIKLEHLGEIVETLLGVGQVIADDTIFGYNVLKRDDSYDENWRHAQMKGLANSGDMPSKVNESNPQTGLREALKGLEEDYELLSHPDFRVFPYTSRNLKREAAAIRQHIRIYFKGEGGMYNRSANPGKIAPLEKFLKGYANHLEELSVVLEQEDEKILEGVSLARLNGNRNESAMKVFLTLQQAMFQPAVTAISRDDIIATYKSHKDFFQSRIMGRGNGGVCNLVSLPSTVREGENLSERLRYEIV